MPQLSSPCVAVIGGGFCGAVFAVHLARAATRPLAIDVIEPRAELGRGVAYGAAGLVHRMNTLSERLILFKEDPLHFERWLKAHGLYDADADAHTADGQHYAQRLTFGDYVGDLFDGTARQTRRARPCGMSAPA